MRQASLATCATLTLSGIAFAGGTQFAPPGAFGANAQVESFEGIVGGSLPISFGQPPNGCPYAEVPVPWNGLQHGVNVTASPDVRVHDFALNTDPNWAWQLGLDNGAIGSGTNFPSGSACLSHFDFGQAPLRLEFDVPVARVGAFVEAAKCLICPDSDDGSVRLQAFDSGNNSLGQVAVFTDGTLQDNALDTWIGIQTSSGLAQIKSVEFVTGSVSIGTFVLDDLTLDGSLDDAPVPQTYCTAKASSSGCLANMTVSNPSQAPTSGAGDYNLFAVGAEANRAGVFFFGQAGQATIPFNGGILCALPPVGRGPLQFSGGAPGTCTGMFNQLLNTNSPLWDPGPGTTIWSQTWYRDPQLMDGFNTALSNAIEIQFE